MNVCLLTHHPQLYTHVRLKEELGKHGLELQIPRVKELCWVWPNTSAKFDLTFNRLSAVESAPVERALAGSAQWGTQLNPWDLRQRLWDKASQAQWVSSLGLSPVPSLMYQGPLNLVQKTWSDFAQQHRSPLGWVLKFNRGQKGVGVNYLATDEALFSWLETLYRMGDQDFLIQPRLEHQGEYRLTVLNGKPWALLRREGAKGNFAQGASAVEVPIPSALRPLVEVLAGHTLGAYLCVDLLMSAQGPVILDVNSAPGVEQLEQVTGRNFLSDLVALALILQG